MIVVVVAIILTNTYQSLNEPLPQADITPQSAANTERDAGLSSTEIIALDLFGAQKLIEQPHQGHQDIPETKLKLILKGAFGHSDPKQASALIASDKNKQSERFFINDELPGNAVLEEVYPNYVVLRRGARLEKLLFPRAHGLTATAAFPSNHKQADTVHQLEPAKTTIKSKIEALREKITIPTPTAPSINSYKEQPPSKQNDSKHKKNTTPKPGKPPENFKGPISQTKSYPYPSVVSSPYKTLQLTAQYRLKVISLKVASLKTGGQPTPFTELDKNKNDYA